MNRVDIAKPIGNWRESAGVKTVHFEGVVVCKYVPENDSLDLFTSQSVSRDPVELFLLQGCKEALHSCVVEAVCGSAQVLAHSTCGNLCTEIVACVLTASVTVENCTVECLPKSFPQIFNSIDT